MRLVQRRGIPTRHQYCTRCKKERRFIKNPVGWYCEKCGYYGEQ